MAGNNATYANLFRMPNGRIYNFIRAFHHDPNYMFSDDDGTTWAYGGRWLYGKGGYSPYLKFAYDGKGTVHFVATEDHPRNFDNNLYHGYLRDGDAVSLERHQGRRAEHVDRRDRSRPGISPRCSRPTRITWPGWSTSSSTATRDPTCCSPRSAMAAACPAARAAWISATTMRRWNGTSWHHEEIAYAGRRLYAGEDDYSGLGALDPNNPDLLYISTDADPVTGAPLVSAADGKRHYELFRGQRAPAGKWTWTPFTRNSTADNLRPVIPHWNDPRTAIVWMRGAYVANQGEWYSALVAAIVTPSQ